MLDELVETGYTGTELGDWGYMPTDPQALSRELVRRGIVMLGAFVPVALKDASSHRAGRETAVNTARLLAAVAREPAPFLVLADNNGSVPQRTLNAGRITSQMGLSDAEWKIFAEGANSIARAVREATGLETVFHHHCAGYVETPDEIERFLELTDPKAIGLVFDTGHYVFGAGDCDVAAGLNRFRRSHQVRALERLQPGACPRSRAGSTGITSSPCATEFFANWDAAVLIFPKVLRWLKEQGYEGYVLVEQDVLPGMGAPKDSALRNREYLRSIEQNFA